MEKPEHPLTRPREGQPVKAGTPRRRYEDAARRYEVSASRYMLAHQNKPFPQEELHPADQKHFKAELNTLKWGHTIDAVRQRTRRWLMIGGGAAALIYLLVIVLVALIAEDQVQYYYYSTSTLNEVTTYLIGIVFAASVLDKFYFDFIGLSAGIDSLSKDFSSGRWDLICITNTSMAEVVRAKYVAAQLRAWRTMLVVICLRVGVLVMVFMYLFVSPILAPSQWRSGDGIYGTRSSSMEETMIILAGILIGAIMAGVYVLEPRWRLRALAAGSVRASAHSRDTASGLMRIGGTFLRLWVAQIGTLVVLGFASAFASAMAGATQSLVFAFLFIGVGYTALVAYAIRMTYVLFAQRRLNETHSRLVRLGGAD